MQLAPNINFLTIVNLSGVIQCLFLAVVSFSGPGENRQVNRLFGFFLLSLSILFFDLICYSQKIYAAVPLLYGTIDFSAYTTPTLLFLYVKAYTRPDTKMNNWNFMHLAFPGLMTYLLLASLFLIGAEERLADYKKDYSSAETLDLERILTLTFNNVFYLAYWVASFRLIRKVRDEIDTKWLKWMMGIFLSMIVFGMLIDYIPRVFNQIQLLPYMFTITVYSMVYMCIMHSPPFFVQQKLNKYKKSGMTPERADEIVRKLQESIEEQQLYLDSGLTLAALAKQLHISKHYISQVLNEKLGVSFFQYVNQKRIDEVKRRLADDAALQMTIAQIAYDVGFNSLSSFNTAFKKQTGQSPSEYMKEHLS